MRKPRNLAGALVLVVISAVLALSLARVSSRDYFEQLSIVWDEQVTQETTIPTGEIVGSKSVGQIFRATQQNLGQIDVLLSNYRRPNESPIVLSVRPVGSEEVLRLSVAPPGSVGDNLYHSFSFAPIRNSADRTFEILLTSPRAKPGRSVTGWLSDQDRYHPGWALVDGNPQYRHDLAVRVGYRAEIEGVVDELVNRVSQYKARFLKGFALVVIFVLAVIMALATLYVVAFSTLKE